MALAEDSSPAAVIRQSYEWLTDFETDPDGKVADEAVMTAGLVLGVKLVLVVSASLTSIATSLEKMSHPQFTVPG